MPIFNFATITPAQALALTASDTVQIDQGSANNATVLFGADTISLTVGSLTVTFATTLSGATTNFADGSRLLVGTPGNDAPAAFGNENNGLYGGSGTDTLSGGGGLNQLQGNQGDDSLIGGSGYDVIYGGQDNDTIAVGSSISGGGTNFAQGNRGADTVNGSAIDNDILLGGQGSDVLGAADRGSGRVSGAYTLYDNPTGLSAGGNDFVNGNLGDDVIFGGSGNDTLVGEDGNDFIDGSGGRNLLEGGAGNDFLTASGQSTIDAGAGNDAINLGAGTFVITLGEGNDQSFSLFDGGQDERVTIDGGAGRDQIRASRGADVVSGGADNDVLLGWGGADTLSGGDGSDEFAFFGGRSSTEFSAIAQIVDWTSEDILYFQDLSSTVAIGAGTELNYVETSAADYNAALLFANTQIGSGSINYVVAQVGSDVFLFADSRNDNGVADTAVRLVGRSLNDISASNFLMG